MAKRLSEKFLVKIDRLPAMSGLELGECERVSFSKIRDPAEGFFEQGEVNVLTLQTMVMV